jgi:transcriptional antiterminator NusG
VPVWYALWTRSRHEQLVRRELEAHRVECFLPTFSRWSAWKDRTKKIEWPLFPGYCFARFDESARLMVLNCTGVVDIVSFAGKPAPIPDHEIDNIRLVVQSNLRYDPWPFIHQGMRVVVVRGPLKGVVGRLIRKGPHSILVLSVEPINRALSIQVDACDVAPV